MAAFMQQPYDVANLNKFPFVPEGNLHLQCPPEYLNCFDVRTLSTFPDGIFMNLYRIIQVYLIKNRHKTRI